MSSPVWWEAEINSSTPVVDNVYVKYCFTYAENDDGTGVRYPTDVKSAGFRSQLEGSHESNHTEEL